MKSLKYQVIPNLFVFTDLQSEQILDELQEELFKKIGHEFFIQMHKANTLYSIVKTCDSAADSKAYRFVKTYPHKYRYHDRWKKMEDDIRVVVVSTRKQIVNMMIDDDSSTSTYSTTKRKALVVLHESEPECTEEDFEELLFNLKSQTWIEYCLIIDSKNQSRNLSFETRKEQLISILHNLTLGAISGFLLGGEGYISTRTTYEDSQDIIGSFLSFKRNINDDHFFKILCDQYIWKMIVNAKDSDIKDSKEDRESKYARALDITLSENYDNKDKKGEEYEYENAFIAIFSRRIIERIKNAKQIIQKIEEEKSIKEKKLGQILINDDRKEFCDAYNSMIRPVIHIPHPPQEPKIEPYSYPLAWTVLFTIALFFSAHMIAILNSFLPALETTNIVLSSLKNYDKLSLSLDRGLHIRYVFLICITSAVGVLLHCFHNYYQKRDVITYPQKIPDFDISQLNISQFDKIKPKIIGSGISLLSCVIFLGGNVFLFDGLDHFSPITFFIYLILNLSLGYCFNNQFIEKDRKKKDYFHINCFKYYREQKEFQSKKDQLSSSSSMTAIELESNSYETDILHYNESPLKEIIRLQRLEKLGKSFLAYYNARTCNEHKQSNYLDISFFKPGDLDKWLSEFAYFVNNGELFSDVLKKLLYKLTDSNAVDWNFFYYTTWFDQAIQQINQSKQEGLTNLLLEMRSRFIRHITSNILYKPLNWRIDKQGYEETAFIIVPDKIDLDIDQIEGMQLKIVQDSMEDSIQILKIGQYNTNE